MKSKLKTLRATLLTCGVSASALASANAWAQTEEPVTDEVFVTGSRIARDPSQTAASPVQIIGGDDLATSGQTDITTLLRETPALQGSLPATFSAFNVGDTEDSDLGLGLLDLRSLGVERTLVLQNGRRHVPGTGGQAAVDVSTIPTSLLERVDILTGGASSIYGADAVTGVVNFILRDGSDFDGLEFRTQAGISQEGDAEEVFVSIANGGEFADGRGNAVFSVEYNKTTQVLAEDRPFAGLGFSTISDSNAELAALLGTDPNAVQVFAPDYRLPVSSAFGIIALGDGFASAFSAINDIPGSGVIPTIPGTNIPIAQVFDNGVLRAFDTGVFVNAFNASGGDGITQQAPRSVILPDQDRLLFNAAAEYEVRPNIEFFAEAKFAFTDTSDQDGIPFNDDIPIQLDNPFVPAALLAQANELAALGGDPQIAVSRDILDADVFPIEDTERTTIRFVGGFRGEIPTTGLDYEVAVNWGRTEVETTSRNERLEDRFFAAIDAVALSAGDLPNVSAGTLALRNGQDVVISSATAQAGDIVCRSQLNGTPPGVSPFPQPPVFPDGTILGGQDVSGLGQALSFAFGDGQCAPINIIGADAITGAGADFAFVDVLDSTTVTQLQILATISGDSSKLFELPGGPVGFALGFEYREDRSLFTPSSLRFAPPITNGAVTSGPTLQSPILNDEFPDQITVTEGFLEANLPLLKDLPYVQKLEIIGSARFSDYNTIGRTTAWSVGSRWQVTDDLTLRGTYSRAVRAPNIGELFSPVSPAAIGVGADPCDVTNIGAGSAFREANCLTFVAPGFDATDFLSAFVPGTSGGNPSLQEESAETFTGGFVYRGQGALTGLSVIADYYNIGISGAIDTLTGAQIAAACVDLPTTDNTFCDNIFRDPTDGFITGFTAGQINLGSLDTAGVDWQVVYDFELPEFNGHQPGKLRLSATGTRFLEFVEVSDPTSDVIIDAIADPVDQEVARIAQDITNDQLGEFTLPRWIINFNADWTKGAFTFTWNGRFESSQLAPGIDNIELVDVENVGGVVTITPDTTFVDLSQQRTGAGFVHDFNVNYDVSEAFSIYGGVNNALDREPFLSSLSRPFGPRGRFFFLGVQAKF